MHQEVEGGRRWGLDWDQIAFSSCSSPHRRPAGPPNPDFISNSVTSTTYSAGLALSHLSSEFLQMLRNAGNGPRWLLLMVAPVPSVTWPDRYRGDLCNKTELFYHCMCAQYLKEKCILMSLFNAQNKKQVQIIISEGQMSLFSFHWAYALFATCLTVFAPRLWKGQWVWTTGQVKIDKSHTWSNDNNSIN